MQAKHFRKVRCRFRGSRSTVARPSADFVGHTWRGNLDTSSVYVQCEQTGQQHSRRSGGTAAGKSLIHGGDESSAAVAVTADASESYTCSSAGSLCGQCFIPLMAGHARTQDPLKERDYFRECFSWVVNLLRSAGVLSRL